MERSMIILKIIRLLKLKNGVKRVLLENRKIVFKALVGSHNYNLNSIDSDKDYKLFTLPTFEELYHGKRYAKQIITPTEDLDIHDIRKLSDLYFKANINYLETLASKEIIIPQGNEEIEKILSLKKEIFKMNLPYLFDACYGMHKQKMSLLHKGTEGTQYLVDEFGYDTKQAQHAYRCLNFLERFEATGFNDFEKAIQYTGDEQKFMKYIKGGLYTQEQFIEFVTLYLEEQILPLKEKYRSYSANEDIKNEIDFLIMRLIRRKVK